MNAFNLPPKSILYVMDAYCGWCWGFSERLGEFEAANRHRVAFTAISGGLFVGERAKPIAAYPHIHEANAHIARLTGAVFGDAYNGLLKDGHLVMDSVAAGAGLAVLRVHAPTRAVHWAHELQAAFYDRGLSLSDPATIASMSLFAQLITKHLETERKLQESEVALLDARETSELREQFIAVLGHDLRNPLFAINVGAEQAIANVIENIPPGVAAQFAAFIREGRCGSADGREETLQLTPATHRTDGFFVAIFEAAG